MMMVMDYYLADDLYEIYLAIISCKITTVVPTKSDSDVLFCLQLLSKTLTCTHHLS